MTKKEMDIVWDVFKQIEDDAKKRFFEFSADKPFELQTTNTDLPTIDINEPLPNEDYSDIPF